MSGFNTRLTGKVLMIFLACLQLIKSTDIRLGNHEFHDRRFVRLSLKSDAFNFNVQQNDLLRLAVVSYGEGIPVTPLEQFVFLQKTKDGKVNPPVEQDETVQAFYTRLCGYLPTDNPTHSRAVYVEFPQSAAFDNSKNFHIRTVTEVIQGSTDRENSFTIYIPKSNEFTSINKMLEVLYSSLPFNEVAGNVKCLLPCDYQTSVLQEFLQPDSLSYNVTTSSSEASTNTTSENKSGTTKDEPRKKDGTKKDDSPVTKDDIKKDEPEKKEGTKKEESGKKEGGWASDFCNMKTVLSLVVIVSGMAML